MEFTENQIRYSIEYCLDEKCVNHYSLRYELTANIIAVLSDKIRVSEKGLYKVYSEDYPNFHESMAVCIFGPDTHSKDIEFCVGNEVDYSEYVKEYGVERINDSTIRFSNPGISSEQIFKKLDSN